MLEEGAGEAVADRASLTGNAAAGDGADDVKLAEGIGEGHRLTDDQLEGLKAEIVIDVSAVHSDIAGAGVNSYAGNRMLSAACAVEIRLALIHRG